MRTKHYLRNAVSLGTSLTALFLLVRCTVTERDYSVLGIGGSAGNAGTAGGDSGGDGSGGTAAGQGGGDGLGGQDGGTPVEPIPCDPISFDAGTNDAGTNDAGDASSSDAGSNVANPYGVGCACVDGFIQAIDADGDGAGTRDCSLVPGLDCNDGDGAVTHNACGGCTELPNAVGEDCLDCGAYVCDGPEAVVCGAKPDYPVIDPDCRCQAGLIVARDTDGDGEGTRLCEQNPGIDCNDGNSGFVSNECGGCESLGGTVGGGCNECGVYACNGAALVCVPNPAQPTQCLNTTTRQTCINDGFWGSNFTCDNVCYQGNCEVCTPGTFQCTYYATGDAIQICAYSTTFSAIMWVSYASCLVSPNLRCNPDNGSCTSHLLLPRDRTFDVVPPRGVLPWHELLNTASESDYG